MTYPGNGEGPRTAKPGALLTTSSVADASGDCVACLGRDVPTFLRTYDNHPPIGPICRHCVGAALDERRPLAQQQCSGCYDTGPARLLGRVGFCPYCVTTLTEMAVAA